MNFKNILTSFTGLGYDHQVNIANDVANNIINEFLNFMVYIENSDKHYLLENNYIFRRLILSSQPNYFMGQYIKYIDHDDILNIINIPNLFKNHKFEVLLCSFIEHLLRNIITFGEHYGIFRYNDLEYSVKLYYNLQDLSITYIEDVYNDQLNKGIFSVNYANIDSKYKIIGDSILDNNNSIKLELENHFENLFSNNSFTSNKSDNIDNIFCFDDENRSDMVESGSESNSDSGLFESDISESTDIDMDNELDDLDDSAEVDNLKDKLENIDI